MGLKILHSADWHLDSPFQGFSESQRAYLKEQQRKLPGKIAELCRRENCDLVLLAGDIFDGEATRDTVERVKKALEDCAVPVFVAPGNHDFCAPGSPWREERWPANVIVFTGGMTFVCVPELNCRVYGGGFQSMDSPALLEGFRAEGEEAYSVAVLHGDPGQRNSPYNPITNAQVRNSSLDYLALGHIHKAGTFRSGNTLCAWPGCPMGRGWDETGEKGVCIVTLDTEARVQAVSLDTPRFHDLEVDIGCNAAEALEAALPAVASKDFYRVTLTGFGEVDLEELGSRFADFPNLELRDRTEPPMDLWGDSDLDSLEGVYFNMLRDALEENPEKADRIRQAAEISRRLLAGKEVIL